ncbi:MAG: AAA family ATPase [Myxococcota bacterium]|nr:AAA family ATPase [Myxococcota bacterium]
MKIRRIRIRAFRKLVEPVDIRGLGDGVTVLSGDNEEGKSTVLMALRTVLFERHRMTGKAADSLRPWGSDVRPEVTLEFELGGESYAVSKGFCQQPFAELRTPRGPITGPRVEEELGRLLGFRPPDRGPAGPEHQGVFGLLWVEQGTAYHLQVAEGAHQTLQSALEAEVGAVLGGKQGQQLLAAIEDLYREHFDARGHPRGAWKKAQEDLRRFEGEVRRAREELSSYDRQVDELSRLREQLRRMQEEGRLEQAQAELARARQAEERLHALEAELRQAEEKRRTAMAEWRNASDAWAHREEQVRAEREASEAMQTARQRWEEQARRAEQVRSAVQLAQAALDELDRALKEAVAQVQRGERLLEQARAAQRLAELRRRLEQAQEAAAQQQRAAEQAQSLPMDKACWEALRELERQALQAEAALVAGATRIELRLKPGVTVRHNGQEVGSGPLVLVERTELTIDGVGTLVIIPGGEDLSERSRRAQQARRELDSALARAGVACVADAEELMRRREELLVQAQQQKQLLGRYAPEGLEALQKAVAEAEAALQGSAANGLSVEEAEQSLREARRRAQQAEEAVQKGRRNWEQQSELGRQEAEELARAEARRDAAERTWQQTAAALKEARQRKSDDDLRAARELTRQTLQQAQAAEATAREALAQADPEGVRLRRQGCEEAVRQIQGERDATARHIRDLEIELRTLGQRGLGEQVQALEGELEQARAVLAQKERYAKAVSLLWRTLKAAESRARQAFAAPVAQRMRPYLDILFPGAEVSLCNSTLSIQSLQRGRWQEPFQSLSAGTREQIAVLCRLAFADLLREQGRPAAVVLDDALVYSDEARLQRMLQVLRRAGQAQQVLILTCRERDYLSAGFPILRLADCRG